MYLLIIQFLEAKSKGFKQLFALHQILNNDKVNLGVKLVCWRMRIRRQEIGQKAPPRGFLSTRN
jgi:hypothetical protein